MEMKTEALCPKWNMVIHSNQFHTLQYRNIKGVTMTSRQSQLQDVPIIVEFLAIPDTFDIEYYLSMRESTGLFSNEEINLEHVKFMGDTIKSSPFFVLSKAPELTIASCLFCLEIFREVGLTLESVSDQHDHSKFRGQDFKRFVNYHYKNDSAQVPFCIITVNAYRLVEDGLLEPVIRRITEVEDYAASIADTMEMVKENHK